MDHDCPSGIMRATIGKQMIGWIVTHDYEVVAYVLLNGSERAVDMSI